MIMKVSKEALMYILKEKKTCEVLLCRDIQPPCSSNCELGSSSGLSRYDRAVKIFVERYGEEALFEVLL